MLVSSFNLSQSFNYTPYLFYKNGSKQRSVLSVYGPSVVVAVLPQHPITNGGGCIGASLLMAEGASVCH